MCESGPGPQPAQPERVTPYRLAEGKTADDLYAALKPEFREQLSRLKFADFLGSCRRAGLLDESAGGILRVRPADQAKFPIALK